MADPEASEPKLPVPVPVPVPVPTPCPVDAQASQRADPSKTAEALLNYGVNDVRAAADPKRQTPPEFQLEVLDAKELTPWLFSHSPPE